MNNIKLPWASQFIANHKSYVGHNSVTGSVRHTIAKDLPLRWELSFAFGWRDTKEGYEYWRNISKQK